MSFISDLADLMPDTVTWYPLTGRDAYGAPTYGAGTSYSARVIRQHKLVRDLSGDEKVSSSQAWVEGSPSVGQDDKVTLSDGTSPPVIAVERFQDEDGASHTVVLFR